MVTSSSQIHSSTSDALLQVKKYFRSKIYTACVGLTLSEPQGFVEHWVVSLVGLLAACGETDIFGYFGISPITSQLVVDWSAVVLHFGLGEINHYY